MQTVKDVTKTIKRLTKCGYKAGHFEVCVNMMLTNVFYIVTKYNGDANKAHLDGVISDTYSMCNISLEVDGNSVLIMGDFGTHYLMSVDAFNDAFPTHYGHITKIS